MQSIGFMPSKLLGSVRNFELTKLDVNRSIQFHELYLRGKLIYRTARFFGRRLSCAYGWEREMFIFKETIL